MRKKIDKTDFAQKDGKPLKDLLEQLKADGMIRDFFFETDFVLINGDCNQVMPRLIANNQPVDHILADIPYGTIQNLPLRGWKERDRVPNWDRVLDLDQMFHRCFYLSKANANLLLFSQEHLTTDLINAVDRFQKYALSDKMIWVKKHHANPFNAKTTPVHYYEEILLIRKRLDETNSVEIRQYFKDLLAMLPDSKAAIIRKLGQGVDHCFRFANRTFRIPTESNYQKLIATYGIDKFSFFIPYATLQTEWARENTPVFNRPGTQKIVKDVLEFGKDLDNIHPTQKPLGLLRFLVRTFSNENDVILDFTAGSGSTGIACLRENRRFIGIELDQDFYQKAVAWYLKEKARSED